MAGLRGNRGSGGSGDRDEQRRREREARERARERRREKTDEKALEARAREREEAVLRAASAERQAEETRAAAARWREAEAVKLAAVAPSAQGAEVDAPRAAPPQAASPQPDYTAPLTRAGRERQAVFAPAQPAAAQPVSPAGRPAAEGDGRRADRPRRPRDLGAGVPRRAIAAGLAAVVAAICFTVVTGGGDDGPGTTKKAVAKTKKARGKSPYGTPTETILPPKTRVVAYTGAPQAKELGILGTMPFEQASSRLDRQAKPYDRTSRPVLRAFDLIATIADAHPGPAGKFRTRQTSTVIARYLRAARRHDAMLILDVQPGGSNFVDELRPLERWLKEPDVHLALDPEWRMRPGVKPGSEIGYVSAGEITATLARVAEIVRAQQLPPKLVLVHRFTDGMIKDLGSVKVPKEIVGVISIDGVGNRASKVATYARIAPTLPKPWLAGFKLFYQEDAAAGGLMYGEQVMALKPRPHVVLYE